MHHSRKNYEVIADNGEKRIAEETTRNPRLKQKIEKIKKQISDYCEENNTKGIKSKDKLLRLSKKLKTVFPKKGRKGRKEIMDIMRKSDEWKQAVKFDVIKLGISYDKGKLSQKLMLKLKPYVKKEEAVRLYVSSLTKKKKKE